MVLQLKTKEKHLNPNMLASSHSWLALMRQNELGRKEAILTKNQIAYQDHLERIRSNKEQERLKTIELGERHRSSTVSEMQQAQKLAEDARSHRASEELSRNDLAARLRMKGDEISSNEKIATLRNASQEAIAAMNNASKERVAAQGNTVKATIAELDRLSREDIAESDRLARTLGPLGIVVDELGKLLFGTRSDPKDGPDYDPSKAKSSTVKGVRPVNKTKPNISKDTKKPKPIKFIQDGKGGSRHYEQLK